MGRHFNRFIPAWSRRRVRREQPDSILLAIKLQPRAHRDEIQDAGGAELNVRVTAPPVDSAANQALVRLLSAALDCPRGAVQLVRGRAAPHKVVRVSGLSAAAIADKLAAFRL